MKYAKKFDNLSQYNTYMSGTPYLPNVSLVEEHDKCMYTPKPHDYSRDYLTFVALDDCEFVFDTLGYIRYSVDDGLTWSEETAYAETPVVAAGNKVLWKGEVLPGTYGFGISSTGRYDVEGNTMSIIYGDNFIGQTSLEGKDNALHGLFGSDTAGGETGENDKLIHAHNLILPATTLSRECYFCMFSQCTNLLSAPELPATTLAYSCYEKMFYDCSSLISAPELPATTLATASYHDMFSGCRSLNYIKCLATDISAVVCTDYWVDEVASGGTFVKAASMTDWTTGENGIPSGWTIQNA